MDSPIASRIKNFVSEGRTSDALALLLEASLPNKQVHDAVHLVLGEFNDLTSNRLRDTIDDTEATLRLNIIHNKILIALNSFDSEGKPLPGNVVADLGPTGNILLRGGLLLFVGSILLVLLGLVLKIMSLKGASEVIVTGFCLGLGGLFLLGCWLLSRLSNPLKGR